MASFGLTTPSIAAAMIGRSKRRPHSSQPMSTSLGLTVSTPGTSAISSNPYATLALRPRPTHIPIAGPFRLENRPCPAIPAHGASAVCRDRHPPHPLDLVQYKASSQGVSTGARRRDLTRDRALKTRPVPQHERAVFGQVDRDARVF